VVTCGSGLLWMRGFCSGALPLVHVILAVTRLVPLAAPLAWAVGRSPIHLVASGAEPALAPAAALLDTQPPAPVPPRSNRQEDPEPERGATAPVDQLVPATPPTPVTIPLADEDDPGLGSAPLAQSPLGWRGTQGIAIGIAAIWLLGTVYQLVWLS